MKKLSKKQLQKGRKAVQELAKPLKERRVVLEREKNSIDRAYEFYDELVGLQDRGHSGDAVRLLADKLDESEIIGRNKERERVHRLADRLLGGCSPLGISKDSLEKLHDDIEKGA